MIDLMRRAVINTYCPGYSRKSHWIFFHRLLAGGSIRKIAILGVYQGRDIAYMCQALEAANIRDYSIIGVDRFADVPGEDWPAEKRGMSWRQAGFGLAPRLDVASRNLRRTGFGRNVTLIQGEAEALLNQPDRYDFIYIDISHDYESTRKAIGVAAAKSANGGIIGGDDFSDQGTWGVSSAVKEMFSDFQLHDDWIWWANSNSLKPGACVS